MKIKRMILAVMLFTITTPFINAQNVLELIKQNATENYIYFWYQHNARILFDVTVNDSDNVLQYRHHIYIEIAGNYIGNPLKSLLDFNDTTWNIKTYYQENNKTDYLISTHKFSGFMKILENKDGTLKLAFDFRIINDTVVGDTLKQFYKGERTFIRNDSFPITIIDTTTHNYFVLDNTHTIITAYDKSNNLLWQTTPQNDSIFQNKILHNYRTDHPTIRYFYFAQRPRKQVNGENLRKVIYIFYNNSQQGYLELDSGKFHFEGQD